jgi:TRAP-type C4-dicarboxylate transport system substrate-binding protein
MMRAALLVALCVGAAHADPMYTLRMATVAPQGSAWANELSAFAREVGQASQGALRIHWYFGGVTGDEEETYERIKRGQLDGTASGGMICAIVAPSMLVMRLPGVFQNREEAAHVMTQLRPSHEVEARQNGYTLLVTTGLGPEVIFSRNPVRSMEDLRRTRFWRWSADRVGIETSKIMGIQTVPTTLDVAAKAYDDKQFDGFIAIPTAALAFQWSAQAHYITDLRVGFLTGCVLISNAAFDRLPLPLQGVVRGTISKYDMRFEDLGRRQDDALLGGLFTRQGMVQVPVDATFRGAFFSAARTAREKAGPRFTKPEVIEQVLRMLADYRGERSSKH